MENTEFTAKNYETVSREGSSEKEINPETATGAEFRDYLNSIRENGAPEDFDAEKSEEEKGDEEEEEENEEKENSEGGEIPYEENEEAEDASASAGEEAADKTQSGGDDEKTFTQDDVNRIVGERLRERNKEDAAVKNIYDDTAREAMRFYGTDNPSEAMRRMIDDLRSQNAASAGQDVSEYVKRQTVEEKARAYDESIRENAERDARIREIRDRWERESAELKTMVPEFDFEKAMATNENFKQSVLKGSSIAAAYMRAHTNAEKISKKSKKPAIKQNAAASKNGGAKAEFDPLTASDTEFNKYISSIRKQSV